MDACRAAEHADQRLSVKEQRIGFASSSLTPDVLMSFLTGCFERPGSDGVGGAAACLCSLAAYLLQLFHKMALFF